MNVKELKQCNSSVSLGNHGEKFVVKLLGGSRIFRCGHDIDHAVLGRLEVKTAILGQNGSFQFCLKKADKFGQTDYSKSDYVVLVCLSLYGDKVYLIPVAALPAVKKLSLSVNSKRFSEFRIL